MTAFVAQNVNQGSKGGNPLSLLETSSQQLNSRSNEIRRKNRHLGFDEEQRKLFRQLGRGESPFSKESSEPSPSGPKTLRGNCFSRSCSAEGRVSTVEPRDIKFEDLCREYAPGEEWKGLSLARQAEYLGRALRPRMGVHIDARSPYMRYWDLIVLMSLMYTAVITPYEVALITQSYGALFAVNCLVDGVFVKDMIMQFMLKVRVKGVSGSERWLRDPWALAIHYLQGWFLLDLLSVLPIDHVLALSLGDGDEGGQKARLPRVLRIFRLLKLARVLRASRVLKRWETQMIVLSFSTQTLVKFIIWVLTLSHWMACAWAMFGKMLATNFVCAGGVLVDERSDLGGQSWITRRSWPPDSPCVSFDVYLAALHFSVMTITSIGYGDVAPTRSEEYLVGIMCQVTGAFAWAFIIGSACGVITNVDPETKQNKQEMDELNQMLRRQNISPELCCRLRRYLAEARHHKTVVRARELCQDFSPDLRGELVMSTPIGRAITNVWYFKGCESTFLVEIAQTMIPRFFNKHEVCEEIMGMLGICQRGAVARNGHIFLTGHFWGEDMILTSDDLRDMYSVISLTFSEVLTLGRPQLDMILRAGVAESSRKRLQRAALIIAFSKASGKVHQERVCGVRKSKQLHDLFDAARSLPQSTNWAQGSQSLNVLHRDKEHLRFLEHEQGGEARLDPFQKKLVEELRSIKRSCSQDFQGLANSYATATGQSGAKSSNNRTGTVAASSSQNQTPPNEMRDGSAACSSQSGPLEVPTLHLHDEKAGDQELASPEKLAALAAQAARLSRRLIRLGVSSQPPHPRPGQPLVRECSELSPRHNSRRPPQAEPDAEPGACEESGGANDATPKLREFTTYASI